MLYKTFLVIIFVSLFPLHAAATSCSTQEIISLSKSGYSKTEIDKLCSPAGASHTAAPTKLPKELALHEIPASIKYQGEMVQAVSWNDALGINYLLITHTGNYPVDGHKGKMCDDEDYCLSAELFGYHFVDNGSQISRLWRINDFIKECSFDITLDYLHGSLEITDLDHDGISETSFIYRLACRSDISGASMKLLMHEGTSKYAIRGYVVTPLEPGEINIDPSFNTAPVIFREHAIQRWHLFNKEFFDMQIP